MDMRPLLLIFLMPGVVAAQSVSHGRDIPAIARDAKGTVVSILMSDKDGRPVAQGSGFLVSADGRVMTDYHVIRRGRSAVIKLPNGAFFVVEGVLAIDKLRDIALIKAQGENFHSVTLGNSDQLQVGEEVVAIGNPLSLESTVSNGIVSGIRTIDEAGGKFLQITAPISPGSSGGPLFNLAREVVGITTSGFKGGGNLNFAIPINDAKRLLLAEFSKIRGLPDEAEPVKTQTTNRESRSAVSAASLSETLQWLAGASDKESGDGNNHITFESKDKDSCDVTITETRIRAGPDWWTKVSFSLADIDPGDIQVENLAEGMEGGLKKFFEGQFGVSFHTSNYRKTIVHSTKGPFYSGGPTLDKPLETPASDYMFFTNEWFAPRFAKAFKHAVQLCGGKRSSF
jgi:hypothetical protein